MKRFNVLIFAAQAVLITVLMVALAIAANENQRRPQPDRAMTIADDDVVTVQTTLNYSRTELEDLRTTLLTIGAIYHDLGLLAPDPDLQALGAEAMDAADRLTMEDLALLAETGDSQRRLLAVAEDLHADVASIVGERKGEDDADRQPATPGLPDAPYSNLCGADRPSTGLLYGALLARTIAESAQLGASRACDQVVVAAGFGSNAALACLVLDVLYAGAKGFEDGLNFCVADIDSYELEATYERTEHLHSDVEILDDKVDMVLEQLDMIADAIEELRVLSCSSIRLLNTPEGLRAEDCPTCDDQPLFPYEFPEGEVPDPVAVP